METKYETIEEVRNAIRKAKKEAEDCFGKIVENTDFKVRYTSFTFSESFVLLSMTLDDSEEILKFRLEDVEDNGKYKLTINISTKKTFCFDDKSKKDVSKFMVQAGKLIDNDNAVGLIRNGLYLNMCIICELKEKLKQMRRNQIYGNQSNN